MKDGELNILRIVINSLLIYILLTFIMEQKQTKIEVAFEIDGTQIFKIMGTNLTLIHQGKM